MLSNSAPFGTEKRNKTKQTKNPRTSGLVDIYLCTSLERIIKKKKKGVGELRRGLGTLLNF